MARRDVVQHPKHYTFSRLEVIDVIEEWGLGFHLGNVVKYIARAPHKGREVEDLRKARWYLDRQLALLERATRPARTARSPKPRRRPSRA